MAEILCQREQPARVLPEATQKQLKGSHLIYTETQNLDVVEV